MATNGASARSWLEQNGAQAAPEEIQRIRTAIAGKLDALSEDHPDEAGLLEALDVMDTFIEQGGVSAPVSPVVQEISNTPMLDTSPLVPELAPAEELSPVEKQARFRKLLQSSR